MSLKEPQHSSLLLRARRAALVAGCPCLDKENCVGESPLLFRVQSWYDVQGAVSNAEQAPHVTRRGHAGARDLWS